MIRCATTTGIGTFEIQSQLITVSLIVKKQSTRKQKTHETDKDAFLPVAEIVVMIDKPAVVPGKSDKPTTS